MFYIVVGSRGLCVFCTQNKAEAAQLVARTRVVMSSVELNHGDRVKE